MEVTIINGANLNLVGRRNPEMYGSESMEQIILRLQRTYPTIRLRYLQSNHEGDLIDWVQELALQDDKPALILNAGGYTHTSVSLRDAVEFAREQGVRIIEVHLSNIYTREKFRQVSLLSDVCEKTIIGNDCYEKAMAHILTATL